MLLGNAAGKVGDLVFYRAGGEQRTRTRVTPKNPRTLQQQAQRSKIANVTMIYRALSALCKDSFPSRKVNQTPFSAFSQENMPKSPYLKKDLAMEGRANMFPAMVAKGSIPYPFGTDGYGTWASRHCYYVTLDGTFTGPITNVKQLTAALTAWRPCCFKEGTELIFVRMQSDNDDIDGRWQATYAKVTLNADDETQLDAFGIAFTVGQPEQGEPDFSILSVACNDIGTACALVIANPKQGGGYEVSDATLLLDVDTQEALSFQYGEPYKTDAAISYGGDESRCVVTV